MTTFLVEKKAIILPVQLALANGRPQKNSVLYQGTTLQLRKNSRVFEGYGLQPVRKWLYNKSGFSR